MNVIKRNKRIYHFAKKLYELFLDRVSNFHLKRKSRTLKKNVIRVGFLCQMPEIWDKQKLIYDEMCRREHIEPIILAVPPFDFVNGKCQADYSENWFLKNYPNAIKVVNTDGEVDVRSLALDYIFYQRPYDEYLPQGLKSKDLVRSTKICFLPYMYCTAPTYYYINRIHSFLRNVYFNFTDIQENYIYLLQKYKKNMSLGSQQVEYLGFPEFEDYYMQGKEYEGNILWTPRWSYDKTAGGSHFFEYKDEIIKFKKAHPDIHITIRPHPLMFDNFVRQGQMTFQEVSDYKERLQHNEIILSLGKPLKEDLLWADILITDFSSIIPMYFVTGKPMIHCDSNYKYTKEADNLLNYEYKADNWKEIESALLMLLAGEDTSRKERKLFIQENYKWHLGATTRIVDRIEKDGCIKSDNKSRL